ncbi:ComEA family DNA-binding protein [Streptomyces albireticuli]|uniref:DNA-binding protein n=1 Tax=Streptomyces albireticuli TaxID=1940 RepID=A0A2A2DCM8_9ACTN|nr:ComEA family DNA-binding protein [Streptomyces albireticuli]MCD9141779.1 ComEA family DNA-binding protein [Streptomyces albireticuli]MCD9163277.1 ComEA family DNA-binding protein [Streptomyces albireticuli]MCD9189953.1 ComEA family DNA-binding protein [Streptomyces albireticuli]PAU49197.1 DNA-binding protein [Streptomyces albireticuli]
MTERLATDHLDGPAPAPALSGGSPRERAATLFPGVPAPVRDGPGPPGRDADAPDPGRGGAGWRSALGERLPLWVRLRCGIEPRTLGALAVVLVAACAFAVHHFWAGRPGPVRPPDRRLPAVSAAGAERAASADPTGVPPAARADGPSRGTGVVVDVAGKVPRPGLQRLPAGSRVADALEAAGGARPGTDTTGLNRARVLTDGEQIVVGASPQAPPPPGGPAPPGGPGAPAGPISLNTATAEQLDALPGVGPVLARHILDYRARNGGFRSVDDLRHVNGIGTRRLTDLRPLVRP